MTTTTAHNTRCLSLAQAIVMEELDIQGIDYPLSGTDDDAVILIPAWNTTVEAQAEAWLSDGTATCACEDS